MKLSILKMDKEKEENGAWVEYGAGLKVKIGRLGNEKSRNFFIEKGFLSSASGMAFEEALDSVSGNEGDEILCDVMAEAVLLDWENLQNEDGSNIPFSKEAAKRILNEYPEFRNDILKISRSREHFRLKKEDDAVKN